MESIGAFCVTILLSLKTGEIVYEVFAFYPQGTSSLETYARPLGDCQTGDMTKLDQVGVPIITRHGVLKSTIHGLPFGNSCQATRKNKLQKQIHTSGEQTTHTVSRNFRL